MALFEIKPVDREFFAARLERFLPARAIDVHTHVWLGERAAPQPGPQRTVTWPSRVAAANSVEDLAQTYRLMLPGCHVTPVIFGSPSAGVDPQNEYVAAAARRRRLPALLLCRPQWSAEELEVRIAAGRFAGVKPYLNFAPPHVAAADITIFDFLPPHQLEVLDRRGGLCMLHLPRPGRLRDPLNLEQLLRIERDFPNVRLIVAHVGRAYCHEDVGDAFDVLAPTRRMCFDISANTNADIFARALAAVGPRRVLFGSDLPIVRMRMRRICESGRYVNLVPPGLYGDIRGDSNMRHADPAEADRLTFFLYEGLDAFRRAADIADLSAGDVEAVFFDNAARLLAHFWTPQQENPS